MKKILSATLMVLLFSITNFSQPYNLENAFPNLSFSSPVFLTDAGDGTNRVFVVQQNGIIKVFPNASTITTSKTFLDITDRVASGGEMGLLGLAFHPDYSSNGYFYVNYTTNNPTRRTVIARFSVTSNPDSADKNSELEILTYRQPFSNHNGGWVGFRPSDGYLYIGVGDGGSGGDPNNYAQNIDSLLGKILRIDIDNTDPGLNYGIPLDNPFFDSTGSVRREIYAWGMRNPWRNSFDPVTDWFWCADVGQNAWEEIDLIESGKNYGWRCYEGTHNYNTTGCNYPEYIFPIWEYPHSPECSITGGYVYRGPTVPSLDGKYIYGDYCSAKIWSLEYDGINPPTNTFLLNAPSSIYSFGVDQSNELYIICANGNIYRFVAEVPVELNTFSVRIQDGKIILEWETASEINNQGFEIQRSRDNKVFSTISFVEGNGSTTQNNSYHYVDEGIQGKVYYRLKQIDFNGTYTYSDVVEADGVLVSSIYLEQNYPNPFNPESIIKYQLGNDGFVKLKVFNSIGEEVVELVNQFQKAGNHQIMFDGKELPSGMYVYKLSSGKYSESKKMILMK